MFPVRALLALGLASLGYAAYIDFEGLPDTGYAAQDKPGLHHENRH
jgi:hypothetical protein